MAESGTTTTAVDTVMYTLGDVIHLQRVSAKRPAAAIFKTVIRFHSGVTGVTVTEL